VPKNGRVVYVAAPGRRLHHPERIHRRQQRLASNSVYSATKAAVRSFARTWTTDLRDRRIRVNAVSTGSTDTPGLSEDSSYITGTELFVDGGFAQV
jgi:NAD(P)-dependent dehydrogenase (short-subunit alcohol dehydrogenase family)